MATRAGWVVVLIVLPVFLFLLWSAQSERPIRIGLALSLSGEGTAAAVHARDGALLAMEVVNEAGGINSHPLRLVIQNDRNEPDAILEADRALLQEKVVAIVGHSSSENTRVAYPLLTSNNVLLFSPFASTTGLSGKQDLFFRSAVDNRAYGKAFAALFESRRIRSAAVLLDRANASLGRDLAREIGKHCAIPLTTVLCNSREQINWPQVVGDLLAAAPSAILLATNASQSGICSQMLRKQGFQGELFATPWAQAPELMLYGGEAVEGVVLLTHIDPTRDQPDYQAFSRRMEEKFRKAPASHAVKTYEAVQILVQALKHCSYPPTAAQLAAALAGGRFQTIQGEVRLDRFGEPIRPLHTLQIRNGGFFKMDPK